jgi:hypothetical protein
MSQASATGGGAAGGGEGVKNSLVRLYVLLGAVQCSSPNRSGCLQRVYRGPSIVLPFCWCQSCRYLLRTAHHAAEYSVDA